MFSSGTYVRVIGSSVSSTVGPRVGSLGFFSEKIRKFNFYDNSITYYGEVCNIVFYRFGFDKHRRIERRTVLSVTPIMCGVDKVKVVDDEEVNTFAKKISKIDQRLKDLVMSRANTTSDLPIVLLSPARMKEVNIYNENYEAFVSFIESCLTEGIHNYLIVNAIITNKLSSCALFTNKQNNAKTITDMMSNKNFRRNMLMDLFTRPNTKEKEDIVILVKSLMIIYNLFEAKSERGVVPQELVSLVREGFAKEYAQLYLILSNTFEDAKVKMFLEKIESLSKDENPTLELLENVRKLKNLILRLSEPVPELQ